jgi:hypothetical protein
VTECYTEELDQDVKVGDDDHSEVPPDAYDKPVPCAKQPPELLTSFGYLFAGEIVQLEEAVMAWLAQFAMRSISNVDIVHVDLKQEFVYFVIDMPGFNIRQDQPSLELKPGGKLHAWVPLGNLVLQNQLMWTPLKMVLQGLDSMYFSTVNGDGDRIARPKVPIYATFEGDVMAAYKFPITGTEHSHIPVKAHAAAFADFAANVSASDVRTEVGHRGEVSVTVNDVTSSVAVEYQEGSATSTVEDDGPLATPFAKFGIDTNVYTMSGGIDDKVKPMYCTHNVLYSQCTVLTMYCTHNVLYSQCAVDKVKPMLINEMPRVIAIATRKLQQELSPLMEEGVRKAAKYTFKQWQVIYVQRVAGICRMTMAVLAV